MKKFTYNGFTAKTHEFSDKSRKSRPYSLFTYIHKLFPAH